MRKRQEPDWAELVRELRRPAVTMVILWEGYRKIWPDGYAYSRFCELLREFQQRLSPVMRQHHLAGDKLFIDYSGKRQEIYDPLTGEVRMAEIFVAVLGAWDCREFRVWAGITGKRRPFMSRRKEPSVPAALLDQLLAGSDAGGALQDRRLLDSLKKTLAERALNAEMDHHLDQEGRDNNSRNGYGRKTVTTDGGKIEIEVPRDRAGRDCQEFRVWAG